MIVTRLRRMQRKKVVFLDMWKEEKEMKARPDLKGGNVFQAVSWIDRDLFVKMLYLEIGILSSTADWSPVLRPTNPTSSNRHLVAVTLSGNRDARFNAGLVDAKNSGAKFAARTAFQLWVIVPGGLRGLAKLLPFGGWRG
jgi:hypothetical protein